MCRTFLHKDACIIGLMIFRRIGYGINTDGIPRTANSASPIAPDLNTAKSAASALAYHVKYGKINDELPNPFPSVMPSCSNTESYSPFPCNVYLT